MMYLKYDKKKKLTPITSQTVCMLRWESGKTEIETQEREREHADKK